MCLYGCVRQREERETHLLQTGGVELCLINDLYSHLEAKQERVNLLLHFYSLITLAAVGLTHPAHTNLHSSTAIAGTNALHFFLETKTQRYNLTALSDKHTITAGGSCIIGQAYRQGHTQIHARTGL